MASPEDDDRLDELEHEIDAARRRAVDHGTIPDEQEPEVEYESGDPVGAPEKENEE